MLTQTEMNSDISGKDEHLDNEYVINEEIQIKRGDDNAEANNFSARDKWRKLKKTMATSNKIHLRKKRRLDRDDSFLRKFSTMNQAEEISHSDLLNIHQPSSFTKNKTLKSFVIHPSGGLMFYWLGILTLAVLYNLWTCIAREAFREIQKGYMTTWFCLDGLSDFIYVCDILVQFRTGYLQQGIMVCESSKLCKNYVRNKCFCMDIICMFPLDFLQFYTGIHPMLRFPRFLKIYRTMRFMHMYESRTAYPNLFRVASLSHILFLGSHWFAAFYYLISEAEGFQGAWSYPEPVGYYAVVIRKYLASMYWSTLTLTTIGDLPPPDTNWQYAFVIVSYLIGVFIFATIVGQVGNIITNRNASRQEFERLLDSAKFYMQMHNVPPDLQKRVQRWYDYVWARGRLNCNDINSLGLLPDKLKTELALHVNLGTLRRVTIFQKCRPEFLHDLMLKMRAYIFTPGDLICRRGEVAREMFIIADGVVEIIGENATVLKQMSTGDFFGEIGILNLDGGINKRTADVRSVGYSELFVLSREDVLAALKDYPDAEQIIREYGQKRLKETEEHRKKCRSAPNSPEPTVFRSGKTTNKSNWDYSRPGLSSSPAVNCLQKLGQVSPRLRKFFSLRNKRIIRRNKRHCVSETQTHFREFPDVNDSKVWMTANESDMKPTYTKLDMIHEINDSKFDCEPASTTNKDKESNNFAELVWSLLKSKGRVGYVSVKTKNTDNHDQFSEIKIENLDEVVLGTPTTNKNGNTILNNTNFKLNDGKIIDQFNDHDNKDKENHKGQIHLKSQRLKNVAPPQIILTSGSDENLSDSNSSEDDIVGDRLNIRQSSTFRHHVMRKSSPCLMSPTPALADRPGRKFSFVPSLDSPIEVPPFTNFRNWSGNNNDISCALERLKALMDTRLNDLEILYKETLIHLQDLMDRQEEMMQTVLRKLSAKQKTADDCVNNDHQLGSSEDQLSSLRECCSKHMPVINSTEEHSCTSSKTEPSNSAKLCWNNIDGSNLLTNTGCNAHCGNLTYEIQQSNDEKQCNHSSNFPDKTKNCSDSKSSLNAKCLSTLPLGEKKTNHRYSDFRVTNL